MEDESSAQCALRDVGLVACILDHMDSDPVVAVAGMVCRVWHTAACSQIRSLSPRTPSFFRMLARSRRFCRITALNLTRCCLLGDLEDEDLRLISSPVFFPALGSLSLGHPDALQSRLTFRGLSNLRPGDSLHTLSLRGIPSLDNPTFAAIARACPRLRSLALEDCHNLSDHGLLNVTKRGMLEAISLKGAFDFSSAGLAAIGEGCKGLNALWLDVSSLDITPALLSVAANCPCIQEISVTGDVIDLHPLKHCSSLTHLFIDTMQNRPMDESVIAIVSANAHLQELIVVNRYAPLSDFSIISVARCCQKLKKLRIDAARLSSLSILALAQCKNLRSLSLNVGLGELTGIGLNGVNLEELAWRSGSGIRNTDLQTLIHSNYSSLRHLDLQRCQGPSPIGYSVIALCSGLQALDLSFTTVDDISLAAIADGVKQLKQLSVERCEGIGDVGVISRFKALQSLSIDQCISASDKGLYSISQGCLHLAHLSLAFTEVSDHGLLKLTNCSQLQTLNVPYCRNIEGLGVIAIAKACQAFQHVVLSQHFKDTEIVKELRHLGCIVRLEEEIDQMALVPFGFNLQF